MLTPSSPEEYHAWVEEAWEHLGIDAAVGEWTLGKEDKDGVVALLPLLYHLKAKPHKFLNAMHLMSAARHAAGRKAMALFPLRRLHVLGHMRVDQNALDKLLGLGCEYAAQKAKSASKAPDLNAAGPSGRAPKRKRDDSSLLEEKAEVFNQVLDLRAAGVHRRHHFAFAFTTDGVSVHLNMEKPKPDKAAASKKAKAFPARGIHSIDAIKALAKAEELHTIGIDPGKRELIVAVDADDPQHAPVVRYTLAQRQRHMRTRQYVDEGRRSKPQPVAVVEEALSLFNSKAPSLCEFAAFAAERRRGLSECPQVRQFYDELAHRNRRRKTKIKAQQSEADVVKRLKAIHPPDDKRPLVLAYGAWGLVAGRPNTACNKGNPPAIGAGLMKKLARAFVVVPTPEHYTSKTCAACGGLCGPHQTLKTNTNKEIRGLRVCQNEGCGLRFWNRDKLGARNIATQFDRLLTGKRPLKALTAEELEYSTGRRARCSPHSGRHALGSRKLALGRTAAAAAAEAAFVETDCTDPDPDAGIDILTSVVLEFFSCVVFNCGADDHLALRARVFDTPTSRAFIDGCPHQITSLHAYGDEVYGSLRHALPQHKPQPLIPPGGIAYSTQGQYLCIFFGQRPAWAVDYIAQIEVGYEYLQGGKWRDLAVTREDPLAMESY